MYLVRRDEGPTKPLGNRGVAHKLLMPGAGELRVLEIKGPAGSDFVTVEDERSVRSERA